MSNQSFRLTLGRIVGVFVLLPWLALTGCGSEETDSATKPTAKANSKEAGAVFTPKTAGKACTADKDCGNGRCAKDFPGLLGASQVAPGGYCTFACQVDADCGAGASCSGANAGALGFGGTAMGTTDGVCLAVCSSSAECREGYRCFDALGQTVETAMASASTGGAAGAAAPAAALGGVTTCGIAPATDKLAAGVAGGACGADADCSGGRCMTSDILMSSYPGGYCTGSCVSDSDCGGGAVCSAAIGGMAGTCYRKCEQDGDCKRDGYRCRGSAFPQGGAKRCLPGSAPLPDGVVGVACANAADCGASGTCSQSMPGANGEVSLPGGYCTNSCVEDLDCGSGGKCVGSFGGIVMGSCYQGCAMDSDCRADYACTAVGLAGFGAPAGGNFGGFGNRAGGMMGMMGMQTKVCAAKQTTSGEDAGVP